MEHLFEFNNQLMPQSLVNVSDIGDSVIEASNDDGFYYYLINRTIYGVTHILTFGPVIPDINTLADGFKVEYTNMDYKEDKVIKFVNMWLNDRSKKLTEAKLSDYNNIVESFPDILAMFMDISGD